MERTELSKHAFYIAQSEIMGSIFLVTKHSLSYFNFLKTILDEIHEHNQFFKNIIFKNMLEHCELSQLLQLKIKSITSRNFFA